MLAEPYTLSYLASVQRPIGRQTSRVLATVTVPQHNLLVVVVIATQVLTVPVNPGKVAQAQGTLVFLDSTVQCTTAQYSTGQGRR